MRLRVLLPGLLGMILLLSGSAFGVDPVELEPTVIAVRKVLPAVVNINTERTVRRAAPDRLDEMWDQYIENRPRRAKKAISQRVQSLGSGFVIDPQGYIITNEHVVERAADMKIQVTFQDGTTLGAVYITGDPKSDLALIKVEAGKPIPFIDLKELSPNELGQTVIAVGNPLGYESTITRGVLSGKARSVVLDDVEYSNLLQTDAAINPGNSGGPLIDIAGRLVGLSSVKMAFTPDGVPAQGLGFAIPADFVAEKILEFQKRGPSAPRAIPVNLPVATTPETATDVTLAGFRAEPAEEVSIESPIAVRIGWERFGMSLEDSEPSKPNPGAEPNPTLGVRVGDVQPGGPASLAGLKPGLVIYKVGRYQVNSTKDIEPLFQNVKTGKVVDFAVGVDPSQGSEVRQQVETVRIKAR